MGDDHHFDWIVKTYNAIRIKFLIIFEVKIKLKERDKQVMRIYKVAFDCNSFFLKLRK